VLVGGEWSASRPGRYTPGERAPGSHWIGGWVGPRTGLDDVEKRKFLTLPGLELRPLCCPARSQSLCRLSYLGSCLVAVRYKIIFHTCEVSLYRLKYDIFTTISIFSSLFPNRVLQLPLAFVRHGIVSVHFHLMIFRERIQLLQ
jgi:hypothetical protein